MSALSSPVSGSIFSQFYTLTKPRVVQLIVFCALIGMVFAVFSRVVSGGVRRAVCLGESPDDVADFCHIYRLCRDLHRDP